LQLKDTPNKRLIFQNQTKQKMAKSNSKNVKKTVNRARTSLQNLYQIQQANEAKDKQTSEMKCQKDLNQPY
jgi:hypothetical protein